MSSNDGQRSFDFKNGALMVIEAIQIIKEMGKKESGVRKQGSEVGSQEPEARKFTSRLKAFPVGRRKVNAGPAGRPKTEDRSTFPRGSLGAEPVLLFVDFVK